MIEESDQCRAVLSYYTCSEMLHEIAGACGLSPRMGPRRRSAFSVCRTRGIGSRFQKYSPPMMVPMPITKAGRSFPLPRAGERFRTVARAPGHDLSDVTHAQSCN